MNKYIISKRNALVKLDTDKLDVDHIDHSYNIDRMWFNDLSNYYERKKEFLEKERNRNSGEKICDSCEPVCECSNNY